MKHKKFLAVIAVLVLTGSTAYGYDSRHYTVNEDLTWYEVTSSHVPSGGAGIWAFGGDIIPGNFPGGLALYISQEAGDWTQDLNVNGGTLAVFDTGKTKTGYGGYIRAGATGKIIIDGTDLNFHDLQYGFKLNASETRIKNNQLNLVNDYYGVCTLNDAQFFAESKNFSAANGEIGLYSAGQGSISVTAGDTALFQNNSCAVYTAGEGTAELKGNKLEMIDNNYGISSSGKSVTIDVDGFTFGTSTAIDFPITAVYGGGNTKVDVTAGKADLNGQIMAEDNAEIQFLEDAEAGGDQLISVYSPFGDAVSAGTDSGTAKIGFQANAVINSQGDEEYHADKQGVRTIAAVRALRNSEISLDKAAGIYGDIIAGKGPAMRVRNPRKGTAAALSLQTGKAAA